MVKQGSKQQFQTAATNPGLTFGEYAHLVIATQYHAIAQQITAVIADKDPENLHQMRVGTRRLRTALQVFAPAIQLPKAAGENAIKALAKVLGQLRDLDVQLADLTETYRPQLDKTERKLLDGMIRKLRKKRRHAYKAVKKTLEGKRLRSLKTAYETWLETPQYTAIAQLPLADILPDLLSPLLAELLLHPGWLIPAPAAAPAAEACLHDLRKACKHVRYQTEFFVPFYGDSFQRWVKEIKSLQDDLGKLQDAHVLNDLLRQHLPKKAKMPTLQAQIQKIRTDLFRDWDSIRGQYLAKTYRQQLHQMVLDSKAAIALDTALDQTNGTGMPSANFNKTPVATTAIASLENASEKNVLSSDRPTPTTAG